MKLGINDIVSLTRFNRTRNAARNGGGSGGGGYSKGSGPNQKTTGKKTPPDQGGSKATTGQQLWYQIVVNGQLAYAQFASTTPVLTLPPGAVLANAS